ncbi:MAG: macro domain-containing protein, partial [Pseudomonadota bacterium]|nr:macro domain-containing protein [Pseudomonadota bacterium]
LAACYRNCLALAGENGIQSIAFPSISTGVYGYPVAAAARIAVAAVAEYLEKLNGRIHVTFCCFGVNSTDYHRTAMAAIHLVC